MNAPLDVDPPSALRKVALDDKYARDSGRVFLNGVQALVRLPMLQKTRDLRAGLNTAGYISGYRGSPLGGLDLALSQARAHLARHDIVFQPGVNEELAADAVWGTQQVSLFAMAQRDGVFGLWYGKGPGVDRAADALKHANAAGTSAHGGVLMLAGDDHACKSSTMPHQSEHLLIACGIPVLYPAGVQEFLDYGLHGWAMSRYSGLWAAMKCVTDIVDSSTVVELDADRPRITLPRGIEMPAGGLGIRWPDPPLAQEARMLDQKWHAALAYVQANGLNRVVIDSPHARFGILTAGKAYLDVRQALADLGLDDQACRRIGIRLMKVGCVWPLDAQSVRQFATGLEEILVVEEKRQLLESALRDQLYNWRQDVRPRVVGKYDQDGEWSSPRRPLLPMPFELSPAVIEKVLAARLALIGVPDEVADRMRARLAVIDAKEDENRRPRLVAERKPWFCSGCPHNSSTSVPAGSRALAGIGCHYLVLGMNRSTDTFSQMGGEGVSWLGQMHFTGEKHVFANLGDGTYFHSGLLAIRAAIAAKANITYKILYNDAVAMTGGQAIDGVMSVQQIAQQLTAEGASRVVLVSDEPQKYAARAGLPEATSVHHRDRIESLQRELREVPGTTVLIYEQVCATEKRRRRKRGKLAESERRPFINTAVCEGCGDCSSAANCLSIEPLQTPTGTKRRINQYSCNKDLSCLQGFCPSFITAEGARLRQPVAAVEGSLLMIDTLPEPSLPTLTKPFRILIAGIGGTGIVTVGALLGMAAHLEHRAVTVLDMTGLAQKGGSVYSNIQIAASSEELHASRISVGEAHLLIGCDAIVAASADALARVAPQGARAVINTAQTPTANFVLDRNWSFPSTSTEQSIRASVGAACDLVNANELASKLVGDSIYANPLLLGYVWQKGWLPLSSAALLRAMELNGVAVEKNQQAFQWGRHVAVHGMAAVDSQPPDRALVRDALDPATLDEVIHDRVELLTRYQNVAYATRYADTIARLRAVERSVNDESSLPLTTAIAVNLAKLMAYKDEYEVGRLYSDPTFFDDLRSQFDGEPGKDYRLSFHMAPPLLASRDADGRPKKRSYGPWMLNVLRVLAKLRTVRGTALDPFGYTAERRMERRLVEDYVSMVNEFCTSLRAQNTDIALQLARLPEDIRGFGHVKERAIAASAEQRQALLDRYRTAS